jgi:hypothetical protein
MNKHDYETASKLVKRFELFTELNQIDYEIIFNELVLGGPG